MEKESLTTLHEMDLEGYLQRLRVLNKVQEERAKCKFCDEVINLKNIHALFPESGEVKFVCDKPKCIKLVNYYLRRKKYGK